MDFHKVRGEVTFIAVRSRGPGGQNVNKVSSAALLFWPFAESQGVTRQEKNLIQSKLARWINNEGQLYIRSDEFRDLAKNKSRCLEKLESLLQLAFHVPKKRRPTKPTAASRQRKLKSKNRRSEIKALRQKIR